MTRLSRPAERLLGSLCDPGTTTCADPARDGFVIVRRQGTGVSLGRGSFPEEAMRELLRADLVERLAGPPGRESFAATEPGRAYRRRQTAPDPGEAFAAQQREMTAVDLVDETGRTRVQVNTAESPLAWLRRRRDRNGEPLIDAASFEAGERLRRDLTLGAMLPSVTARWEGAIGAGGGAGRDPAAATDAAIAARQRVRRALAGIGAEMADLLIDLCGFLKGLETIERERGWPGRSGKVAVRLALRQLARHYGLEVEATGPARARRILSWEAALEPAA